jgi:transcriptional regulator with XRE-family HTH domain
MFVIKHGYYIADICNCKQLIADFCMLNSRLKEERTRLGLTQQAFAEFSLAKKRTIADWEKGVSSPTAVQLEALAKEVGADIQYIVTGVRSVNLEKISKQPTTPHFDFEGKLSTIVKVLEEVLNELQLTLNPKAKGEVVETLLMQAMLKHSIPTKDDIYPILKLVS